MNNSRPSDDLVNAVVAAFRAEGMKGDRAQMERFARVAVETCERDTARCEDWARLLLERDEVQGRAALERMVEWYDRHDGRADDFGRLHIVVDAVRALEAVEIGERDG